MELKTQNSQILDSQTKQQNCVVSRNILGYMQNIRMLAYIVILAAIGVVYSLWPSNQNPNVMYVTLGHFRLYNDTRPVIDLSLNATVEVENMRTTYTLDYTTMDVEVEYGGKELGHVIASGGDHVREMGRSSYVDATVELEGVEVEPDLRDLLDDYAKGLVQFDTIAQVNGFISLLFQIPLKAKYLCKIDIDTEKQEIVNQSCNPKAIEFGFSFSLPIPFIPLGQMKVNIVLRFDDLPSPSLKILHL